jgi:hypothetical protein
MLVYPSGGVPEGKFALIQEGESRMTGGRGPHMLVLVKCSGVSANLQWQNSSVGMVNAGDQDCQEEPVEA